MAHDKIDLMLEQILKSEGGYVNNPKDKGGETKYGITVAVARANGYKGSIKNLPKQTAIDIYKRQYWTDACNKINSEKIAFMVLDMNVNHGIKNSAKILQRALNSLGAGLVVDGIVGEKTISAVNVISGSRLSLALTAERLKFYTNIATFNTFGKGWVRRVVDNLKFIDELF